MTTLLEKPIKNRLGVYVCLYFLSIFITPAVLVKLDPGETYKPAEAPGRIYSRVRDILGLYPIEQLKEYKLEGDKIIILTSDPYEIEMLTDNHPHYFPEPKTYGFIQPRGGRRKFDTHDGTEGYIQWKVETISKNKMRIKSEKFDDLGWRYLVVNITDNQVSSIRFKMGINRGHAMGAPFFGIFLPIFVYMVCIFYLITKELYQIFFRVHRYTVDSNR